MSRAAAENRWGMVALLSVAAVVAYTDRLILSVLFVPLGRDLALTDTQLSVLQGGSFAIIYALVGLPLGLLADRMNRRNVVIASILLWCGATLASGFARTFTQFALARFVTGVGEAGLFPAANSMIGDGVSLRRRGLALGLLIMGQILGGGAAVTVGGVLLDLGQNHGFDGIPVLGSLAPWRAVLVVVGLPGALLALALLLIREPLRRERATPHPVGIRSTFVQLTAHKNVLPLFLVLACAAVSDFAVGTWTPALLTRKFGWGGLQIGLWFGGCLIVAGIVASLLAGLVSDRTRAQHGTRGVIRMALGADLAALALAGFALLPEPRLLLGVFVCQFIASSTCSLICMIAIQVNLPNELRGLASSLVSLGNVLLGLGCGPTLVALAGEHLYRGEGALGAALLTVMAPAFVIGALLLARAGRAAPT